jgi:peptidoglycan-associated lipoprotein
VTIEPGIGTVGTQGSRTVSPNESTTYRAVARNRDNKTNEATARLTVTQAQNPELTPRPGADTPIELWNRQMKDAFFDYDKYDIRSDAREALRGDADFLKKYDMKFLVEGHCDERGTEEYNMALGDRRATAAKEYLISLGISPDRMTTISYGKSRPFDPGHNEEAWAKNRRAHFAPK